MARLSIVIAPDPVLKRTCVKVERVDTEVRRLMDDLLETMRAAPGIGLAAPQVGVLKRVIVVDVPETEGERTMLRLADPEVLWTSEETATREEGCLSLPDQYAEVTRPAEARVRYLDHENEVRVVHAKGLLAACLQHEIEHLDGILFVDHLSSVKRNIILRKLVKMKRAEAAVAS